MNAKEKAVKKLQDVGSHAIVSVEFANKIGKPFGIVFAGTTFANPSGNPTGVLHDCYGVDVHYMAERINQAVDGERQNYLGRGMQFRANLEAALAAIRSGK